MFYKFTGFKGLSAVVLTLASLTTTAPQAEPVINGPAQPANQLIDASQWLPEKQNHPVDAAALATTAVALPSNQEAPSESRGTPAPLKSSSDHAVTHVSAPLPADRTVQTPSHTAQPTKDALSQDIRDSVKDVVRPLYQDIATSDVAQALRGLQSELGLDKEQAFNDKEPRQAGSGLPSEATAWEGQPNREAPRTAAQVERDKVLASVMMDKLIDEVTPWAIGLVALYVLGYLGKLALAYGRVRSIRRQQRGLRRRRTRSGS